MSAMHFVSYPKSGRTWLRYALHRIGLEEAISFHHDGFEFNDGSRPTHDFSVEHRLREYSDGRRIVYLRRDPRDVLVSLYYQITGRFNDYFEYRGTLSDFIRDDYFGAHVLARFRAMWEEIQSQSSTLVIDYENCHKDLEAVIRSILVHYQLHADPERLRKACLDADAPNMKAVEFSGEFPHPWLRLRNGSPKVRRGQVGSFEWELAEEDVFYLNDVFGLD